MTDLRFGVLAATVANFNAFRGKDAKILQPGDFFPSIQIAQPKEEDDFSVMARAVHDTTGVWPKRPASWSAQQLDDEGPDDSDAEQDGEDQD